MFITQVVNTPKWKSNDNNELKVIKTILYWGLYLFQLSNKSFPFSEYGMEGGQAGKNLKILPQCHTFKLFPENWIGLFLGGFVTFSFFELRSNVCFWGSVKSSSW